MSEINLIPHLDEIYWRRKFVELEQDLVITQSLADKRLELLRRVEWIYKTGHKFCPICFSYKRNGHAKDCELEKELDDAK